ncbi:MAG TPA: 50S ribosomal protein L31 [Patescibacteria group bacterium]|nr:50S ribosomal protein L31 [Patescibacteria group bacterium]
MKPVIHPQFYEEVKVMCSCGNSFVTGSTKKDIHVEVCYRCHPLYTGEKRFVDTLGQVGKFQKKQEVAQNYAQKTAGKKKKKEIKETHQPKTLKELLTEV